MALDVPTLMFANAFVALLSAALLALAWSAYRDMRPVLWWAGANLLQAPGVMLLALGGTWSATPLVAAGLLCIVTSMSLLWHAARLIEGLEPYYIPVLAGPLIATLMALLSTWLGGAVPLLLIAVALEIGYLLSAAWIVARSQQRLGSRWPLTLLLAIHSIALLAPAIAVAAGSDLALRSAGPVLDIVNVEGLVFLIGSTIFVVAGIREQQEIRQRRTATLDSLTRMYNRGTLLSLAGELAARCQREEQSMSIVMLDLDHFKQVNDQFGHAMGDQVLVAFAETARQDLRSGDLLGRLGGEEFALALARTDRDAALAIAERIRSSFATRGAIVAGQPINATLSAGVACASGLEVDLSTLMREADAALYEAKASGRNRIVLAGTAKSSDAEPSVRVA